MILSAGKAPNHMRTQPVALVLLPLSFGRRIDHHDHKPPIPALKNASLLASRSFEDQTDLGNAQEDVQTALKLAKRGYKGPEEPEGRSQLMATPTGPLYPWSSPGHPLGIHGVMTCHDVGATAMISNTETVRLWSVSALGGLGDAVPVQPSVGFSLGWLYHVVSPFIRNLKLL